MYFHPGNPFLEIYTALVEMSKNQLYFYPGKGNWVQQWWSKWNGPAYSFRIRNNSTSPSENWMGDSGKPIKKSEVIQNAALLHRNRLFLHAQWKIKVQEYVVCFYINRCTCLSWAMTVLWGKQSHHSDCPWEENQWLGPLWDFPVYNFFWIFEHQTESNSICKWYITTVSIVLTKFRPLGR